MMKIKDCTIYSGGLMRCCLAAFEDKEREVKAGEIIECPYGCGSKMIVGADFSIVWDMGKELAK